jgi:hypothetical protein
MPGAVFLVAQALHAGFTSASFGIGQLQAVAAHTGGPAN